MASPVASGSAESLTPEDDDVGAASDTDASPAADPNLSCAICLGVFRNPVRTECGHVFCFGCLESWLSQKPQCPECRAPVSDAPRDHFAERLVANLKDVCMMRANGCDWTGRRGDMAAHLATECLAVTICCPGCGTELIRRDAKAHISRCAVMGEQKTECPWACGQIVKVSELDRHKVRRVSLGRGIAPHLNHPPPRPGPACPAARRPA